MKSQDDTNVDRLENTQNDMVVLRSLSTTSLKEEHRNRRYLGTRQRRSEDNGKARERYRKKISFRLAEPSLSCHVFSRVGCRSVQDWDQRVVVRTG